MQTTGFSASRNVTPAGASILNYHLDRLDPARRYVTGGADGGDSLIGQRMAWKYPRAAHWVIVPANRKQVDPWWERYTGPAVITIIEMPDDTSYADRNLRILEESDVLSGYPAYPENHPKSQRSGTWQTIRFARRCRMPVTWHTLFPPYTGDSTGAPDWERAGQ